MSVFRGLMGVWVGRAYQNLGQVVVRDVGQLLAVNFGDHELWVARGCELLDG